MVVKIDEIDKKLLSLWMDDSSMSYRKLGKKIGVSAATVMNRINKLEREGVITGYTALVDYEKLGYDIDVVINIDVSKGRLKEVEDKLAAHPSVSAIYDVTGKSDIVIVCKFRNHRALNVFLKKIQTWENIDETVTSLILNTIKNKQISVA